MKRTSTLLAITSGKGGVGKSVVAVNLAEALAQAGHSVALIDVDLGQGACAALLNEAPAASLASVAALTATEAEAFCHTAGGLTFVEGAREPDAAGAYPPALYAVLDRLVTRLRRTHDFIVVDTPAGVDQPVRWALDRADLGLLVLVGEPTAVSDAYRLAKLVWQAAPDYPMGLFVNCAEGADDAQSVAARFAEITAHFLHVTPPHLGWLPYDAAVRRSVRDQVPAVRTPGPVRSAFAALAQRLATGSPLLQAVAS